MIIKIPVSVGELLDKISILKIKSNFTKSDYVHKELKKLIDISKENSVYSEKFIDKLYQINLELWNIEDKLRKFEDQCLFDSDFIFYARKVYIINDKRFKIKKEVDERYKSEYREIKIY
ncbi:hypothetical protein CMO86_09235 [Candidatus Woesearchaeota archaeon]|nr:hypothetical protein [Candidatus Woesearchaeota archaeon]